MVAVKLIAFHNFFVDNVKMGQCHIIVRTGRLYSELCISFRNGEFMECYSLYEMQGT